MNTKKSYKAPSLVFYGKVQDLTKAGSGPITEGTQIFNLMRRP